MKKNPETDKFNRTKITIRAAFKTAGFLILQMVFISSAHPVKSQFQSRELDSLLFQRINEFRKSNGKKKLLFDATAHKMCVHHTLYQFCTAEVGHDEAFDCGGINALNNVADRYANFSLECNCMVLECCAFYETSGEASDSALLENIFQLWLKSLGHRAGLLNKYAGAGAVSVVINAKYRLLAHESDTYEMLCTEIYATFIGIEYCKTGGNPCPNHFAYR